MSKSEYQVETNSGEALANQGSVSEDMISEMVLAANFDVAYDIYYACEQQGCSISSRCSITQK